MKTGMQTLVSRINGRSDTKRKNTMILVTTVSGDKVGVGKSYISLRLAQEIDPRLKKYVEAGDKKKIEAWVNERVVFNSKGFKDLINSKDKKLPFKSVVILDEAGSAAASRRWYTENNFLINLIIQTCRYKRLVIIFTVPDLDFIDSQVRKMFNYMIDAIDVDFEENKNICKIFELQYNSRIGKLYQNRIRKAGQSIGRWRIKKADDMITEAYEPLSKQNKAMILDEEAQQQDNRAENRKMRQEVIPEAAKTISVDLEKNLAYGDLGRYFRIYRGMVRLNKTTIMADYGQMGHGNWSNLRAQLFKRLEDRDLFFRVKNQTDLEISI